MTLLLEIFFLGIELRGEILIPEEKGLFLKGQQLLYLMPLFPYIQQFHLDNRQHPCDF